MRLIKNSIKKALAHFGYNLSATPKSLIEHPSAHLCVDLGFVFSHYFLRKKDFFFIQIGACDGVFADQFYDYVIRYGLKGILIEPQKDMFAALERNYVENRNLQLLNLAIAEYDGEINFYRVKEQYLGALPYARGLSSLKKEKLERSIKLYLAELSNNTESLPRIKDLIERQTVKCTTLNTILSNHHVRSIDLLLIDTEGYDFEIIRTIDFRTWRPAIIQFEHSHFSKSDTNACYEFLIQHDYLLSRGSSDTVAYAQEQCRVPNEQARTTVTCPGEIAVPVSTASGPV